MKPKSTKELTLDQQKTRLEQFVQKYQDYTTQYVHQIYGRKKYLIKLQSIADQQLKRFDVEYEDIEEFCRKDDQKVILRGALQNTKTYIAMLSQIAEKLMPQRIIPVSPERQMIERFENILKQTRIKNLELQSQTMTQKNEKLPTSLQKKYSVSIVFKDGQKMPLRPISLLKADQIGHLVVTKGIITRISEIKPEILVATYACNACGCENYQEVFDISYHPLTVCQSKLCKENKVSGQLVFVAGHSKFIAYQQVKIQQTPDQLNPGQIPSTKILYLRDFDVNTCAPGDIVLIQGILLPQRRPGFTGKFDQFFDTYLLGLKVTRQKKKYIEWSLTQAEMQKVYEMRANYTQNELYEQLSAAIAPEIYGLEFVKKGLLLMMAGGVTKETQTDGLKIRGEINVILIGDPGIAKSQLLKKVAMIAPRGIYTTGKGSSGVGLTAAIVKDPITKEIALEAGALILADMGICCIDEFDKMSETDRTAIHEAMEQQTISIAKAGITTTLNARTAVLSAANPYFGRYNSGETLHKNINLPAALLSRFDLVFVLIDKPDRNKDLQLAYHISQVHMNESPPELTRGNKEIDVNFLRTYLAMAKQYKPTISSDLHRLLVTNYIQKRRLQVDVSREGQTYTTTRSLLAIARLCIARAKLRFSNEVNEHDVADVLQLVEKSQQNLQEKSTRFKKPRIDSASQIYGIIKYMCLESKENKVAYENVREKVLKKGYTDEQLDAVIDQYQKLTALTIDENENVCLMEIN